jgi:hypothetical protein
LISDSPLLEHDAMYMMQNIEKSRHKQLERKAREDRRRALSLQTGKSEEELRSKETALAQARTEASPSAKDAPSVANEPASTKAAAPQKKAKAPAKTDDNEIIEFEEDDDDLF